MIRTALWVTLGLLAAQFSYSGEPPFYCLNNGQSSDDCVREGWAYFKKNAGCEKSASTEPHCQLVPKKRLVQADPFSRTVTTEYNIDVWKCTIPLVGCFNANGTCPNGFTTKPLDPKISKTITIHYKICVPNPGTIAPPTYPSGNSGDAPQPRNGNGAG